MDGDQREEATEGENEEAQVQEADEADEEFEEAAGQDVIGYVRDRSVWCNCFTFSVAVRSEWLALCRPLGLGYDSRMFVEFTCMFHMRACILEWRRRVAFRSLIG